VEQTIGLEETDDGLWAICFDTVLIATLDERDDIIRGSPRVLPMLPADTCVSDLPNRAWEGVGVLALLQRLETRQLRH
jgi:hypothetical protein